jgi:hypothetical protein
LLDGPLLPTGPLRAGCLCQQSLQAVDLLGFGPEQSHDTLRGRREWPYSQPHCGRWGPNLLRPLQPTRELVEGVSHVLALGVGGLGIEPTGKAKAPDSGGKAAEVVGRRGLIDTRRGQINRLPIGAGNCPLREAVHRPALGLPGAGGPSPARRPGTRS